MNRYIFKLLSVIVLLMIVLFSCNSNSGMVEPASPKQNPPIQSIIDSLAINENDLSVYINKTDYKLSIYAKDKLLKAYPVVFGTNPIDDKRIEGDRCTPEGAFKVRDYYPHKSWHKFIWIDYPTAESWKKFKTARRKEEIPKEATIGGEVGIHGTPPLRDGLITDRVNWTWGCVAMKNQDLDDLYSIVHKGMKITISK